MDLLTITSEFENQVGTEFRFEILEFSHMPHAFGSGMKAYRINGRNVKINFDGKDSMIEILISPKHDKYPTKNWTSIFNGSPPEFLDNGIKEVKEKLR
jgi:hypothetical protein